MNRLRGATHWDQWLADQRASEKVVVVDHRVNSARKALADAISERNDIGHRIAYLMSAARAHQPESVRAITDRLLRVDGVTRDDLVKWYASACHAVQVAELRLAELS